MATWQPDPSFYPSPRLAAKAPAETIAYVAAFDPDRKAPDGIAVVDVDPESSSYSRIVGTVAATHAGDEFHHFGWNACSSRGHALAVGIVLVVVLALGLIIEP